MTITGPNAAAPVHGDATTMRAIEVARFGGPEVLRIRALPVPRPGAGQALLAVAVADVLHLDALLRSGAAQDFFGLRPPYVPGGGVAGRVLEVGSHADAEWVGRRVVARLGEHGAYAERAVAEVDALTEVPDGVTLTDAGALVHDGLTAMGLLEAVAVQPGERVLVTAAAGGMGVLLLQALVASGATVVGAARGARKLALVTDLGAAAVDYDDGGWARDAVTAAGGPFAVVLDGAGGDVGREAFALTADGGRFSAHGAAAGGFAPVDPAHAAGRGISVRGIQDVRFPAGTARRLTAAALDAARSGRMRPVVGRILPLEEAALAHEAIEQRRAFAKTLLTTAEDGG